VRPTSDRIPELDGIRGIAIALVLIYHDFFLVTAFPTGTVQARIQALGRLSWSGVDLFFVLSGFLIGGILLDARLDPDYFRTFYTRRFFRIIPLYAVFLAAIYFFVQSASPAVIETFGWNLSERHSFIPYALFLQNFSMAALNYMTFLGVTWSLAVEEQFYLVIPFVIRIFSHRAVLRLVALGIVAAPVIRLLMSKLWAGHWYALYVLTPCRMDTLLFGVLGAYIVRRHLWKEWLNRHPDFLKGALTLLAVGMIMLTKYAATYGSKLILSGGLTWIATFYLCAILYAVTQPMSRFSAALRWKPLRGLGGIAYGVYLLHGYALSLVHGLWFSRPLVRIESLAEYAAAAVSIGLTVMICRFSWFYFENPMIQVGRQLQLSWATTGIANSGLRDAILDARPQTRSNRPYMRPAVRIIPAEHYRSYGLPRQPELALSR
jgi:peptidoglycan/LPS O-acetylase OafA/YrhL